MIKKTLLALSLYLILVALSLFWAANIQVVLFHSAYIALIAGIIFGATAGVIEAKLKLKKRAAAADDYVPRHTVGSFMEHWGTGVGIIILIVSGVLLASGRRLGWIAVPEFTTSRITALNLHYVGVFFTLVFSCYFVANCLTSRRLKELLPDVADIWEGTIKKLLLRKKWNETGKYFSSQKSAFLIFIILGFVILVTGVIKTSYFVLPIALNRTNLAHDIAAELFILMLVVHVVTTIAVPSHWRLFLIWFTGKEERRQ